MSKHDGREHIPVDDLSAYADGEIADRAHVLRIEQHLESCADCRDDLRQIQAVAQLLGDLPEPELPRSFRLSPGDVPASAPPVSIEPWIVRQQSAFRIAAMAAVLLLVVVVTIDVLPGTGTNDSDDMVVMTDAAQEEAVPEADEPDAGIMGVEEEDGEPQDVPDEDPVAAPEEEAAEDQDEQERAVETDDSGERDTVQDEPVVEPDAETEADDETTREFAATTLSDDGPSLLRVAAIGLGVLSVLLLTAGFVIPRWWSSSAKRL